jgi:outer membrane protein OmpA-like peptidoglycan-associated protein
MKSSVYPILCCLMLLVGVGQAFAQTQDVAGSRDYALFKRVPYFVITGYDVSDFISEGKRQGVQYKINYALATQAGTNPTPSENEIVQRHKNTVKAQGGKILTDDGNLATMELNYNGKQLFVQVGAYGITYELVVVEKSAVVTAVPRNVGESVERSVARQLQGKGDALFAPYDNYYAVAYQESDFIVANQKRGEKYSIKYLQRDKKQGLAANNEVIGHYLNIVSGRGGKLIAQTDRSATMEYDQSGKNIWLQVKVIGNFYELNAVEKASNIEAPAEEVALATNNQQLMATPTVGQKNTVVADNQRPQPQNNQTVVTTQPKVNTVVKTDATQVKTDLPPIKTTPVLADNTVKATPQPNTQTNTTADNGNGVVLTNKSADTSAKLADGVVTNNPFFAPNLPLFSVDTSGLYFINTYQESDFFMEGKSQGYQYKINYSLKNAAAGIPQERRIIQPYIDLIKRQGGKVTTDDGNLATMQLGNYWMQVGAYGASYEVVVVDKTRPNQANAMASRLATQGQPLVLDAQPSPFSRIRIAEPQAVIAANNTPQTVYQQPVNTTNVSQTYTRPVAVNNTAPTADEEIEDDEEATDNAFISTPAIGSNNTAAEGMAMIAEARQILQEVKQELRNLAAEKENLLNERERILAERERLAIEREKLLIVREQNLVGEKPASVTQQNIATGSLAEELMLKGRLVMPIDFADRQTEFANEQQAEQALEKIAKLLTANAKLKVYVIAHTDNSGNANADQQLSDQRAAKITNLLINSYKISAERIKSRGLGSLSPLASPHSAEGRRQNNRIEVIEQ